MNPASDTQAGYTQAGYTQAGHALAVLAPMGVEAWALRRGLSDTPVICTGIGRRRSIAAADRLREASWRMFAVAGLCGAIDDESALGDVIVASELSGDDGLFALPDAPQLVDALEEVGIRARMGRIQSEDHVVVGAERDRLRGSGAIAVDMESIWLADAAAGRPFAVVRVVIDTPSREIRRPGIVLDGLRALATLRGVAPALETWSRGQIQSVAR